MTDTLINYPFASCPDEAEILQVAAGIYWVRMPLPIPGLEHINLWLLEDNDAWTIVDTGMKNQKIKELWEQIFTQYLAGKPVKTHYLHTFSSRSYGSCGLVNATLAGG